MRKTVLILSLAFMLTGLHAQVLLKPGYYAVFFKDKKGTVAILDTPLTYLSPKAIERRQMFGIPFTEQDLPVSKVYLDSLKKYGFVIWEKSKWFNGVVLKIDDSLQLKTLDSLIEAWDFLLPDYSHLIKPKTGKPEKLVVDSQDIAYPKDTLIADIFNYGQAREQNILLKVNRLHSLGYTGENVTMALLDAGFLRVDKIPGFEHLFDGDTANGEILGYYDFVENDTTVFNTGSHGTMALSTIAAFDDQMVGTAPYAKFYLFRTEDEKSEYKIEEFNWLVAAEKADSLGVDIISSSLGYNDFDDTTMSYTYQDMNGNTALSTIAADIAASKGILVVISAGNEGSDKWYFITAPADADSVLSVGAVFRGGDFVAFFSSRGPSSDGRIKPEVAAVGVGTAVYSRKGKVTYASGTSFSAPTVAGLTACLKQAFPGKSNMEIIRALEMSGSTALHPNFNVGYGVPNGYLAYQILLHQKENKTTTASSAEENNDTTE